ncbi:hypothetical protein [Streptomyces sp. MAA16]|uniref:hypothetical protein n=1 Tax=Streptomyces sp. MAA16 TaxID=3035116 RepID=UPI0024772422|nr:hypothetical protein [Streptomyces sp. MAA16]MDH6697355.1 hypothetical protein [Streptomyces sp. MAA16]
MPGDEAPGEPESGVSELLDAIAGRTGPWRSFVYAPNGNVNAGSVRGGQRVHNQRTDEPRASRPSRVREGPIPQEEVAAAAFGFAEPAWFTAARAELDRGLLFLAGRSGSGRHTAALNLLRAECGSGAPLRALDSLTELDSWQPTDASARGYVVAGLFPSRPLGAGVLGHVRSLLSGVGARMVIVLPDDTALLRRLEQDLHVTVVRCEPPPPAAVFGSQFEAAVPDQRERDRLLGALGRRELGELLVPELLPAEVVELVGALVAADGDATALGDLRDRLSYRAEREVPPLMEKLRDDPDALSFLLAACVYEGADYRIVREEADRLLDLSDGCLAATLPATDSQGVETAERPNPDFVFRRSLTELLHAVQASRQPRQIRTAGTFGHSVEPVVFVRHRQAETVLMHVWREYGRLADLVVRWLREVSWDDGLTGPVGRVMGMAASWGGGRRALRHIQPLAGSERTTGRVIAAHALGIAAQDPVLVAEVRYRLRQWSHAASPDLRTTVGLACGTEFGLARPDVALHLLRTLVFGLRTRDGQDSGESQVRVAVQAAVTTLFQAGNEENVFGRIREWLSADQADTEGILFLFAQLLRSPRWFTRQLADDTPEGELITDLIRQALNNDSSFDATCGALLGWADGAQWDPTSRRAVENLFADLAESMRSGEFRLFVEMDQKEADGRVGRDIARASLDRWRSGRQEEAA